jgi:DNA-binding NarL/FixJ family response regulator
MTAQPSVLVVSSDLMSAVRVVDTAASLGYASRHVDTAEELDQADAEIVVIDVANSPLEPAAAVSRLRAANPSAHFIAVYRHTEPEQARAARSAGCDLVLNRAQFFGDIGGALKRVNGE